MDKETQRAYELFLGRYVINTGRIAQVVRWTNQACGPACTTGLRGKPVVFCTDCKHPDGHYCYIDYQTGITYETKRQIPYWSKSELLQKSTSSVL